MGNALSLIHPVSTVDQDVDSDPRYVIPDVDMSQVTLSDSDRWVLRFNSDEEFPVFTWEVLETRIPPSENNDLDGLQRTPSELKRYFKWSLDTRLAYGSVMEYLLQHRLPASWGRPPFTPTCATPFSSPDDYCILTNEWPYALDHGIVHLVVWTRTPIATDDTVGDMTPESRRIVEGFVQRTFRDCVGAGNVLWFKNWAALQSVRALDHVHVLLRNVDPAMIKEWTTGVVTPRMLA
ncbi:hypothetical protein TD95_001844 [Thielaviopsis punctulata]|uniref:N-acetylglucosamine-induced protein 1 n=1 Tax=Thielaviopsis punctulata TaxID=72032 RepID=A0A0F4ZDV4_9PEZI|nr:hypothetical protein TD95_001844 [Thielaviopsis punctulata]